MTVAQTKRMAVRAQNTAVHVQPCVSVHEGKTPLQSTASVLLFPEYVGREATLIRIPCVVAVSLFALLFEPPTSRCHFSAPQLLSEIKRKGAGPKCFIEVRRTEAPEQSKALR